MTQLAHPGTLTPDLPDGLRQLAAYSAYASAIAAVIGLVFLVLFFTLGGFWGPLNDIFVILTYVFTLPVVFALHRMLRAEHPRLSAAAVAVALVGMLGVIVLQGLLVARVMPFSVQIRLVIPFFFTNLAYFLMLARMGRSVDAVPDGPILAVLAGLWVGHPVWGIRVGRALLGG